MIKSEALMRLEKAEVLSQHSDGTWHSVWLDDVDLTPMLRRAGMFEQ